MHSRILTSNNNLQTLKPLFQLKGDKYTALAMYKDRNGSQLTAISGSERIFLYRLNKTQ